MILLGQFPLFITFFLAKRREAHLSHLATMANSGYPYNFATQYAPYAAPPQQAQYAPYVAPPQQAPYYNHMNGYNGFYPNAYPSYSNPNFYQLQSAEQPRPQYQLRPVQLQPAGGLRPNGRVGAGSMQRRTSTATSTDILDENICIGPRYNMRMRHQETLSATGRVEYNHPGFNTRYENSKFYVMKSCNKEDVLNSIRHRVWATTPMGNRELNSAYHEAQGDQTTQTQSNCPVFLLFSVSFLILIRASFFTFSLFLSLSFS